jgi:hypothetical protein
MLDVYVRTEGISKNLWAAAVGIVVESEQSCHLQWHWLHGIRGSAFEVENLITRSDAPDA